MLTLTVVAQGKGVLFHPTFLCRHIQEALEVVLMAFVFEFGNDIVFYTLLKMLDGVSGFFIVVEE